MPPSSDQGQQSRVPFSHEDVRAYIDTFFLDGSLTPVEQENVAKLPAWVRTGVVHDPKADALRRFRGSATEVRDRTSQRRRVAPGMAASGPTLGGTGRAALGVGRGAGRRRPNGLEPICRRRSEDAFGQWMMQRYGSLHNLPYHQQPVMVHQISRFMAVERTRKKLAKIALLVLDGLAFDQWLLLRKNLESLR